VFDHIESKSFHASATLRHVKYFKTIRLEKPKTEWKYRTRRTDLAKALIEVKIIQLFFKFSFVHHLLYFEESKHHDGKFTFVTKLP
jgi:hypothetical protein